MNCFQIVSLTYWAQRRSGSSVSKVCCELLSDCIFDLLSTTIRRSTRKTLLLWIAFRLYLWPTEHNSAFVEQGQTLVVNCFQIVSLTYWAQRAGAGQYNLERCELLSDCIFDLLSTTLFQQPPLRALLWIAFRLYLWPTEHNKCFVIIRCITVVNCFQIVSLTYWAQLCSPPLLRMAGCELLSDCIFDLLSTTFWRWCLFQVLLWIAFRLYLWPTEHNCFWCNPRFG